MKKTLFTLKPHSIIDVITNSSSELFVGKSQSKEEITKLIEAVYPNYLSEYEEVKSTSELSVEELELYLSYICDSGYWPHKKEDLPVPNGFTFEELYEPEKNYRTGEISKPAWNGEIQYDFNYNFVNEHTIEDIKQRLDPNNELYFLFSTDTNPDWDSQEKLMDIMERYHLG